MDQLINETQLLNNRQVHLLVSKLGSFYTVCPEDLKGQMISWALSMHMAINNNTSDTFEIPSELVLVFYVFKIQDRT